MDNEREQDKLKVVSQMLENIMIDGLAVEECTMEELIYYIAEIKQSVQDTIDYIEGE